MRVYVETSDTRETPGRASRRDVVWTSAPVPVVRAAENGASRKATARDALALVAASPDGAATDDAYDEVWRCSVQGVDVRLDAPLDALPRARDVRRPELERDARPERAACHRATPAVWATESDPPLRPADRGGLDR